MDARIDPAAAFGINLGDAHVIRNVRHTLHSLLFPNVYLADGTTGRRLRQRCAA